jgi:hypothetical protein
LEARNPPTDSKIANTWVTQIGNFTSDWIKTTKLGYKSPPSIDEEDVSPPPPRNMKKVDPPQPLNIN